MYVILDIYESPACQMALNSNYSKTQIRGLNFWRSGCFRQDFLRKNIGDLILINSWSLTGFAWKSANLAKEIPILDRASYGKPRQFPSVKVLRPIHQQGILGNITHKYLYKKGLMFRDFQFSGCPLGSRYIKNYPLDMLKNMGIGSFINFPSNVPSRIKWDLTDP